MGLSRRAYAALRGVQIRAVGKAIATGRITAEADGTIDAAKADAMWNTSRVQPSNAAPMPKIWGAEMRQLNGQRGAPERRRWPLSLCATSETRDCEGQPKAENFETQRPSVSANVGRESESEQHFASKTQPGHPD